MRRSDVSLTWHVLLCTGHALVCVQDHGNSAAGVILATTAAAANAVSGAVCVYVCVGGGGVRGGVRGP